MLSRGVFTTPVYDVRSLLPRELSFYEQIPFPTRCGLQVSVAKSFATFEFDTHLPDTPVPSTTQCVHVAGAGALSGIPPSLWTDVDCKATRSVHLPCKLKKSLHDL